MSLLFSSNVSLLYLEKKSINKAYQHPANSSENSSTIGSKFASLSVTEFIFIATLISQYVLATFLATRNQGFYYTLSHFSRIPLLIWSLSISITIDIRALRSRNFASCHAL